MIHGLSERRTLVRGGKIRIGDKTLARNGREIPRKLDHFRFVPEDPALLQHWHRLYGERPTALPVLLRPAPRRRPPQVCIGRSSWFGFLDLLSFLFTS